ncbi:hypothetical protein ZOSMA_113G00450 [Zostera marina]|uniref:Malic enzyme N-terminal domain-containing protein n=1 Tax=Zostera marina TaxID=29655 RepID=A0A0K9Q4W5_ZOSMR|nr:hypothetical protein ZOSMA_113G00450 [Zostera marina]
MYVSAIGFNLRRVLPVMLDVGTNNKKLLDNSLYLGLCQPRLDAGSYPSIVDEFMKDAQACGSSTVVQFEDFQMKWGTIGVALAGLF